jgi:hypothetical protein
VVVESSAPEPGIGTHPTEEVVKHSQALSDLEAFARRSIDAHRYPGDYHSFSLSRCRKCGLVGFELTIEHHTGSRRGDFKGRIFGQCSKCRRTQRIFSFTGKHREALLQENPQCTCGNKQFIVGECERIERDEGILGFFDEGVVVAKCSRCGENRALVYTD